jgi:pimeloyl-ACP methyl ester carboxylesterase
MKNISFRKKKIWYNDQGKGKTIVLLHGYMESSKIWKEFASVLSQVFRVITIDLPGHGKSECVDPVHTMDLMAEVVRKVLKEEKIRKCVMIGHSLGGYVTLAFAQNYPGQLKGIGLFHSHVFEDTPEGKENRDRTVELIKSDKLGFITQFIPGLFPPESRKKFRKEIEKLMKRAGQMKSEAVIAAQEGMKLRPGRLEFLKATKLPVLFIIGAKDMKIPVERTWEMISLPPRAELLLLRDVAHMGFIEAPCETLTAIYSFARQNL